MPETTGAGKPGESPLLLALYFLAYLSVLVRMILNSGDTGPAAPLAYGLMAGFLAISVVQPWLGRRLPPARHITLAVQTLIVVALLFTKPSMDFYAMLFVAMSIFAVHDLSSRLGLLWLGIFCVAIVLGLIVAFGQRGASFFPPYIAGSLLIGLYGRAVRNAEAARVRSDELRAELEAANRRLLAYAERAEEAAAERERANLARDLHDAATQTVFSMNLTAGAARLAVENDPGKVPVLIDRLQELARDALAEMRTLVRELRPGSVVDEGLVASLERLGALRRRRDGLAVILTVRGKEEGATEVKETIFRTAREALNNVAKHAGVKEAKLQLSFGAHEIALLVQDSGKGFDTAGARGAESFGLLAMKERIEALGGSLVVRSAPGAGTEIDARVPVARTAGAVEEAVAREGAAEPGGG